MTSLHFSLDESLSQSLRRSTFTSSVATLDATSTNSTGTWQMGGGGGGGQTAALKLKVLAGSTVRTSKFTLFHVWTEHMGIVKTSTKFIHQEKSKVTTSLLFKWCSPSGVSSSTSDKCPYTTATKRGPLPEQSNIKRLPLSNTGHTSHQHPLERQKKILAMISELMKKILSNTGPLKPLQHTCSSFKQKAWRNFKAQDSNWRRDLCPNVWSTPRGEDLCVGLAGS